PVIVRRQNTVSNTQPLGGNLSFFYKQETGFQRSASALQRDLELHSLIEYMVLVSPVVREIPSASRPGVVPREPSSQAEKTEVLSDDLLQIERRLESVRVVSHNTHKRMVTCLQGHIGADAEKRHKKLPLTALSQAMVDGGSQLGEDSLIGKMMEVCGDAESHLACELMHHEMQVEKNVL
ncbi:hypothetical protein CRUP_006988, partial [Coryphaenoides rupestris]